MRIGLHSAFVMILASSVVVGGCRTSKQTRRTDDKSVRNTNSAASTQSRSVDSLYMVQNKLLTIIDTMSNILIQDRTRIRDLEIEIAKLKSLIDQPRMQSGRSFTAPAPIAPTQNYSTPAPPQIAETTPPPAPQTPSWPPNDKYSAALKSFNDGRYMDALTSFDELTRSDPNSQYAANFWYWKGESLYALGQYDEAIRTFHDVLDKYPQSNKADDAEFKIGASYEKLGDKINAKSAYERLVLSFPESEYKVRAEARLNKLK